MTLAQNGLHRPIKYRPDIDGLRAIAVTSVVAYHCGLGGVKGGYVGVDVFFVISGYLIGSLVHKEIRGRSFSIVKFYERRAKRILPALFGVLFFSYVVGFLILSPLELRMFSSSALSTITSSSNVYFYWKTEGYFTTKTELNPLLMTWSLGVEEQFYIVFPLLLLLLKKSRWQFQFLAISCLVILSLAVSIWATWHIPSFAFFMLPTRGWELGVGVLLAFIEANRSRTKNVLPSIVAHGASILGIGLIGTAIYALRPHTPFPGFAALLPVTGAVALIAARDGIANRLLSWQPVVFIGQISYSWYLWHWPMLSFARITADIDAGLSTRISISIGLLSLCCAALSYYFAERPFRRSTTPTTKLLLRYGSLAVIAMALPFAFRITNGFPQRHPEVQRIEKAQESLELDRCDVQEPIAHPVLQKPCVSTSPGPAIALIGDSHAAVLAGALRRIAAADGYQLEELAKGWCPPLGGGIARSVKDKPDFVSHCIEFNDERLRHIAADPNIKIVVAAAWWSAPLNPEHHGEVYLTGDQGSQHVSVAQSRASLELGLREMIRQMRAANKSIYLVQDDPELDFDPSRQMFARMIEPRLALARVVTAPSQQDRGDFAPQSIDPSNDEARLLLTTMAAEYPDVHLIDLQRALCGDAGCRFAEGDSPLYLDSEHLTNLGAQIALSGFHFHN